MKSANESSRASVTRRRFLKASTAAAAAAPYIVPSTVFGASAPSNRLAVAIIGTGNQGFLDLKLFAKQPDCEVVALCDVNQGSDNYKNPSDVRGLDPAADLLKQMVGDRAKSVGKHRDFREVIARDDVDAVVVVVPDHWHDLITIAAAKAKKDIYCEKPLGLTITGQQAMIRAVRENGRILQTGSHERSNPYAEAACSLVREGKIGRVRRVVCHIGRHNKQSPPPGWQASQPPAGFDYDTWLGPAPDAPYHPDRCLYNFRFITDYAGGQTTNFGAHSIDLAQWGLGTDGTGPVEIEHEYADYLPEGSLFDAATYLMFRCKYEDGTVLECATGSPAVRTTFYGDDGVVNVDSQGQNAMVIPRSLTPEKLAKRVKYHSAGDHVRNFLDCVKSREEPNAPVEVGHRSASICHLGNIAVAMEAKLRWDPQAERFVGDRAEEANGHLERERRAPWRLESV
ncbi:Gfo/Idh/MocA family oxidoreductase [Botrimarina sp.]|uniref:Gfo/Idh/MocA family protein n=1 Tax=Botrimarina sp. TaxID=2795802 RepID=UPI0032EDAE40